jgi:hypothetical protein
VIYGLPLGFPHYVPLRDSRSLRNGVVEPSYGSFQVVRSELQGSLSGRALQLSIPKALGHCSVEREHFRKPSRRRHLHGYVSTAWLAAVVAVSHNVFSYFLNPLRRSAHAATGF